MRALTRWATIMALVWALAGCQAPVGLPPLTPTQNAGYRQLVGRLGGPALAVAVRDHYAYVGYSFEFAVIDIEEPANPARVAYLPLSANDIALQGNYAYVAGRDGLHVVDVSQPANPTIEGFWTAPASLVDIDVVDDKAYVVAPNAGFGIVDISRPNHPVEISFTPIREQVEAITIFEDLAYLATADGVRIIDVSDPVRPVAIDLIADFGWVQQIALTGEFAYVTTNQGELVVLDRTDPTRPIWVTTLDVSGYSDDIYLTGRYAYINGGFAGLQVVDLSDRRRPQKVAAIGFKGVISDIAGDEDRLFVTDLNGGLHLLELSDPALPVVVGVYHAPGLAFGISIIGGYGYVTAGFDNELHIIDIADPTNLLHLAMVPLAAPSWTLSPEANYLYTSDLLGQIQTIRLAHPVDKPVAGIARATGSPENPYVCIVDRKLGLLYILDVTTAERPEQVGSYTAPAGIYDATVQADSVFIAGGAAGLLVVNLHELHCPTCATVVQLPGFISAVAVDGDYMVAATKEGNLYLLRFEFPMQLTLVSTINLPGEPVDVAMTGDSVFVAAGEAGVHFVSISNPMAPVVVGTQRTFYSALGVAVRQDYIFVADSLGGLVVLRVSDVK